MSRLPPGAVQIAPVSEFNGCTWLVNRHAGTEPLAVLETSPGVFASVWVINKKAMQKLKQRGAVVTLCIDTNVPDHPSISMMVQTAELT
jgi:hypothetical protein